MPTRQPSLLILAAGLGSRYGGLKQMEPVGPNGEYLLDYSVYDALKAGFGKIVFLISKRIETEFKDKIGYRYSDHITIEYAFQELDKLPSGISVPQSRTKPWGTTHAIICSEGVIHEPFAVINADDYYGPRSFSIVYDVLKDKKDDAKEFVLVGFRVEKTLSAYGKVTRAICNIKDGFLQSLQEREDLQLFNDGIVSKNKDGMLTEIKQGTIVSMNMWGFAPTVLFTALNAQFTEFVRDNKDDLKSELPIPTAMDSVIRTNTAMVKVLESDETWFGMTYNQDKAIVIENIRKKIKQGIYPDNLFSL